MYHFKPLLCDTRLTRITNIALFSKYNAPGISEVKRSKFHNSTSGIILKNGNEQMGVQRCK